MNRLALALLSAALVGCATLKDDRPADCHGPRRPANPYGSVLTADVAPPAPAKPGPACGGGPA